MASLGSVLVDQTSIGFIEVDKIMIKLQFYANAPIKHFGGGEYMHPAFGHPCFTSHGRLNFRTSHVPP